MVSMEMDLSDLVIISDDASLNSYASISSLDISDIFGDDTTSHSSNSKVSTTLRCSSHNNNITACAAKNNDSGTSTTDAMSRWGSSGSLCIDNNGEEEQTPRCPQRQPSFKDNCHNSWSPAAATNEYNAFLSLDTSHRTFDADQKVTPRHKRNHGADMHYQTGNHISKAERLQFLFSRKTPKKTLRALNPGGSTEVKLHRMMVRAKQIRDGPFYNSNQRLQVKSVMTTDTITLHQVKMAAETGAIATSDSNNTRSSNETTKAVAGLPPQRSQQQDATKKVRTWWSSPKLPQRQKTSPHSSITNAEAVDEQTMAPPKLPLRQKSVHTPLHQDYQN